MLRHGRRRVAVTLQDGAQGFNIDHTANPNGIPEDHTAHLTLWRATFQFRVCHVVYRGSSLTRNSAGPYSVTMTRALWQPREERVGFTLWRARLRFRDCRVGLRYRGTFSISEQLISRNVGRFRGGLVFKAHSLFHHSTLGARVIKKQKKRRTPVVRKASLSGLPCGLQGNLAHKKQRPPRTLQ